MSQPIRNFDRYRKSFVWLGVLTSLSAIFFADYRTGSLVATIGYYLIPVGLAGWYLGRVPAYAVASVSAACHFYVSWFAPAIDKTPLTSSVEAVSILIVLFASCYLILRQKALSETLTRVSQADILTGAILGHTFREQSANELLRSERYGHCVSLVYFDIDGFKSINDDYGHQTGDNLLKQLGRTIGSTLRKYDIFGRMGGDEFAILLPETDQEEAKSIVKRIQQDVENAAGRLVLPVSLSIGVVTTSGGSDVGIDELLQHADKLMYSVKKTTKNAAAYEAIL
jgi:diguanylate cyclase (GGDEF)-like protein